MKKKIFIAAAVFFSSAAFGQKSLPLKEDSTSSLAALVVTATRFPAKQSSTGKIVTVISKEQIEQAGTKSLARLLNEQAGIVINGAYQSAGSVQTLYTRGAASGRTLLLLDGLPLSDPSMINNEYDLNLFSLNQIERIEICNGAQSTLYGSDAIGGVINIITKSNSIQKPVAIAASSTIGNKNTFNNNLSFLGKKGKWTYSARYAQMNTKGFHSAYDSSKTMSYDRDRYDGHSLMASLQYQLSPGLQINSFLQQSKYVAAIDAGIFADEQDYTIHNSGLQAGEVFDL
jgi:vitamin B12 transporter